MVKRRFVFLGLLAVSFLFFMAGILRNTANTIIHLDDSLQNQSNRYIRLQYDYNPLDTNDLLASIEKYRQLADALKQQYDSYYIINSQPLYSADSNFSFPDSVSPDGARSISCLQINEKAQNDYPLHIVEGRAFVNSDFEHMSGAEIPVLMGTDYQSVYSLDDTFEAEYLYNRYTFRVVGFFDDDRMEYPTRTFVDFNQSVIMPDFYFSAPPSDEELTSCLLHSANQTCPIIAVEKNTLRENYDNIIKLVNNSPLGAYDCYTDSSVFNYARTGVSLPSIKIGCAIIMIICCLVLFFLTKALSKSEIISSQKNNDRKISLLCLIAGCIGANLLLGLSLFSLGIRPALSGNIWIIPICIIFLYLLSYQRKKSCHS